MIKNEKMETMAKVNQWNLDKKLYLQKYFERLILWSGGQKSNTWIIWELNNQKRANTITRK
ncbi:hypothetical protein TXYLGN1_15750 [Tepidimicrobium xylanilyticum]|nr:hypothetical protein EN5CB1_10590 [Tepidimicrobium xylanilyticum]